MKYTYRCNHCNYVFDVDLRLSQVIKRTPKISCPHCKGTTRKLINNPVIHYKGEGFTKKVQEK